MDEHELVDEIREKARLGGRLSGDERALLDRANREQLASGVFPWLVDPPGHWLTVDDCGDKIFTDEGLATLRRVAGFLDVPQAAAYFALTPDQLLLALDIQPEAKTAFLQGRAQVLQAIAESLYVAAQAGDVRAMQTYLKARGGWVEKTAVDWSLGERDEAGQQDPLEVLQARLAKLGGD